MSSKKYILFIGLFSLLTSGLFAQVGTSYDVLDSSLVSKKNLPQHNEFVNNAYPFPAKPRNQWEIGVKAGAFSLSSDGVFNHGKRALSPCSFWIAEMASQRWSSVMTKRKLGFFDSAKSESVETKSSVRGSFI